jgi:hypothetical protein
VDISNNIRLNGVKLSTTLPNSNYETPVAKYIDVSSAIVTLSLDNYIITEDKQLNMIVDVSNSSTYNFPIYITNNILK